LLLWAIFTKVSMAVVVCARASAFTSATSFGLPPGLPLLPFWNVPGRQMLYFLGKGYRVVAHEMRCWQARGCCLLATESPLW
jgi:hypothetical protein